MAPSISFSSTPPPDIASAVASGGNLTLTWTSPNASDTIASFTVQSATVVSGPYTNISPAATITQPGGAGTPFQATVTASGPTVFYRISHL